jgi:hypothetical protein
MNTEQTTKHPQTQCVCCEKIVPDPKLNRRYCNRCRLWATKLLQTGHFDLTTPETRQEFYDSISEHRFKYGDLTPKELKRDQKRGMIRLYTDAKLEDSIRMLEEQLEAHKLELKRRNNIRSNSAPVTDESEAR